MVVEAKWHTWGQMKIVQCLREEHLPDDPLWTEVADYLCHAVDRRELPLLWAWLEQEAAPGVIDARHAGEGG